jgi:hypothetical protein
VTVYGYPRLLHGPGDPPEPMWPDSRVPAVALYPVEILPEPGVTALDFFWILPRARAPVPYK